MITKLEQLTVAQFVDLLCGNHKILTSKKEIVTEVKLANAVRDIVFEYKTIADPAGARTFLTDSEELVKARLEALLYSMCVDFLSAGAHKQVRDLLEEHGISAKRMNDTRLEAEVKSRLERAKLNIKKLEEKTEDENKEPADVRRMFDEQTASLMAYFKFQIDSSRMPATEYAHLIALMNREIKVQLEAYKKIK